MKFYTTNYSANRIRTIIAFLFCVATLSGCADKGLFPRTHCTELTAENLEQHSYDTDGNGRADYYQQLNKTGRIVRLGFDDDQDGSIDEQVNLDERALADCRQLYILLDGVPYQIMAELYQKGHFRLFHRPSRLISSFPSMTDVAFAEVFGLSPVLGFEASYYDKAKGKLHDGNKVYLSGKNEPWNDRLDYRCPLWMDAVAYVWPRWWLDHELKSILSEYRKSQKQRIAGYSVSSTCLGTSNSASGYLEVLLQVEQLCQAAMLASRGQVQITIFADHGHNLVAAKSLPLKDLLSESGFRVVEKLKDPRDVVIPEFGLVTFASVHTYSPVQLAATAVQIDGINLALYKNERGNIVVANRQGKATISKRGQSYRYQPLQADPLELLGVLAQLRQGGLLDNDGYAADADWFAAIAGHKYPDALARIWRAFHGLVQNPPDVILTTKDGWYCGKGKFDFFVDVASTHGSLNYLNSVTFAMTTASQLPAELRLKDLRKALADLGLDPP